MNIPIGVLLAYVAAFGAVVLAVVMLAIGGVR